MESSKNKQQAVDAASGSGSKPARRPHWRCRDPADTAVYVVQPDQFRAVVQQLTGAASSPPAQQQESAAGNTASAAAQQHQAPAGTTTNAPPPQQQQHGGAASSGRTLGQIQQELMAWANSDDDIY